MIDQDHMIESLFASYHDASQQLCMYCFNYIEEYMPYVDDCIQEVFLAAWKKQDKLKNHVNPYAWLANACKKECASIMRQKSTHLKVLGRQMPFEDQYSMPNIQDDILRWIAQNDARQHIETLRAQLTPLENHIFDEYFVHEKAASQIAAEQDCPASSVYGTIQRIRKKAQNNSSHYYFHWAV